MDYVLIIFRFLGSKPFLEQSRTLMHFPGGISSKEPTYQCRRQRRHGFDPWVGKIPWRRAQQPTPVFLLENPMDRGAWWDTVHGVTEGQTQLKHSSKAQHRTLIYFWNEWMNKYFWTHNSTLSPTPNQPPSLVASAS